MSCVNVNVFKPFVAPEVNRCPSALVMNAIREKVIDFCGRTLAWQEELLPINAKSGKHTYELQAPEATRIESLITVRHNRLLVDFISESSLDADDDTDWRTQTNSQAKGYYQPTPRQIRLVYTPDTTVTDGIEVNAALKPIPGGHLLSEDVFNDYYAIIAAGAKSQLMGMPDKSWSSAGMAGTYFSMYEEGIREASGKVERQNQRNNQTAGRTTVYY